MYWNQYPYINLNDLNLDFLLKAIGEMQNEVENFVTLNAVKYANPIQWNITKQYQKNTIVIDPITGTAYISTNPVPSGVALNDTNYWTVVFDLSMFVTQTNKNLTERVEDAGVVYSTFPLNAGDWVVWNGELYEALVNMPVGTAYSPNGNISRVTVENYVKTALTSIINQVSTNTSNIGVLANLVTTDKTNLVDAVNEVSSHAGSNTSKIGDLSILSTGDKSTLVNAINEVNANAAGARKIINRKAILISDSYGVSPSASDNWEEKFESNTGIPCTKFAYSGKGFYTNQVNSILQDFSAENVPDKNTYTDIIACLGANDICTCIYSDISNLIQAIKDFVAYCNTNYPNAIVYIGCIGYTRYGTTYAGTASVTNYLNVLKAYKDAAGQAGAHYLNGVEMVMHYYQYFSAADWLHPTSAGASKLASAIANAYINGNANMSGDGEFLRVTPLSGQINGSNSESLVGLCYIENEQTYYEGGTINWIYGGTLATLNDGYYDLATINPTSLLGNGSPIDVAMEAIVISDLNSYAGYRSIPIVLRIQSGHIYIRSRYSDGSGAIPTVSCNTIILNIPRLDISTLIN